VDTLLFLQPDIPEVDGCEGSSEAIDEEDTVKIKKTQNVYLSSLYLYSYNSLKHATPLKLCFSMKCFWSYLHVQSQDQSMHLQET
jgi:hypothetical protein